MYHVDLTHSYLNPTRSFSESTELSPQLTLMTMLTHPSSSRSSNLLSNQSTTWLKMTAIWFTFIKFVIKLIHNLIKNNSDSVHPEQLEYSSAMILRGFERIEELEIELPSGDMWLEKWALVKWRAECGKIPRSCVILTEQLTK